MDVRKGGKTDLKLVPWTAAQRWGPSRDLDTLRCLPRVDRCEKGRNADFEISYVDSSAEVAQVT